MEERTQSHRIYRESQDDEDEGISFVVPMSEEDDRPIHRSIRERSDGFRERESRARQSRPSLPLSPSLSGWGANVIEHALLPLR